MVDVAVNWDEEGNLDEEGCGAVCEDEGVELDVVKLRYGAKSEVASSLLIFWAFDAFGRGAAPVELAPLPIRLDLAAWRAALACSFSKRFSSRIFSFCSRVRGWNR